MVVFALIVGKVTAQSVTADKNNYAVNENIVASFAGGPGNASDWLAVYPQGVVPDGSPAATLWLYTNGTQTSGGNATSGSVTFSSSSLAVGNYSLWFLANDGYSAIAGPVNFTVTSPPPSWTVSSFKRRHAVSGVAYSGKISGYTNFSSYTYSKVAGPAWLTVSATGELTGTPVVADAGQNTFTVRATDGTNTADATLLIEVFKPGTEVVRELKVMSYNAWHGWGQINNGHSKGLESIVLSGADVIGMQESTDNVSGSGVYQPQKIANDLGWYYRSNISGSLGLISRYPITDQTLAAGIARGIKVRLATNPAQEVILMNCHLDYTDYGPYAAQLPGATESSVLAEENSSDRDEQIAAIMSAMGAMLGNADNVPVLLTGDFNAPSHLDWIASTAGSHNGIPSVAWPTSNAVLGAGMLDTFRVIHPDPAVQPGNTWSPLFTADPQDRIDFVYYKGGSLIPTASRVYTTPVEISGGTWGNAPSGWQNNTWPSDHAAVLTVFKIKPVDADDDGLSDAFENKYFGNTTAQSGTDDADSDGASNQVEQWLATDPNDGGSRPLTQLLLPTSPEISPKLGFSLSPSALTTGIVCERSIDLEQWATVWSYQADPNLLSPILEVTSSAPGEWSILLTDADVDVTTDNMLFYRLRDGS